MSCALERGSLVLEALGALDLRRLTAEAIVFAAWLKRAAEAVCDHGEASASGGER